MPREIPDYVQVQLDAYLQDLKSGDRERAAQALTLMNKHVSDVYTEDFFEGRDLCGVNWQAVSPSNINFRGAIFLYANLSYSRMGSIDFTGADFSYATLEGASSSHVCLESIQAHEANFRGVNFERAKFNHARLQRADFTGADLSDADLGDTNLSGACLLNCDLRHTNLRGADLTDANLYDAFIDPTTQFDEETRLPDGTFWSSQRDLAEFGAETRRIVFLKTEVDETGLLKSILYVFEDGTFRRWRDGDYRLPRLWLEGRVRNRMDFTKYHLKGANFSNTDLRDIQFVEANLRGVNLKGANLLNANLIGALIDEHTLFDEQTILPDGTNWTPNCDLAKFGAETRRIIFDRNSICFADGMQMRWRAGIGWDRDFGAVRADFKGVSFDEVNLFKADLHDVNLAHTDLSVADLRGVNLRGANLQNALIAKTTQFDETTILPDGSFWSVERDLSEFGAETRDVISVTEIIEREGYYDGRLLYTFADGTTRQRGLHYGWFTEKEINEWFS